MATRVRKELLRAGTYHTGRGPVTFTDDDLRQMEATGNAMLAAGLSVPVPLEHQDSAAPLSHADRLAHSVRHNAGWAESFSLDAEGGLWAVLDIEDPEIAHKLPTTIKYVSPEVYPRFVDGAGREWCNAITHIALTPRPVWAKQQPFSGDGAALLSLANPEDAPAWKQWSHGPLRLSLADVWRFAWQNRGPSPRKPGASIWYDPETKQRREQVAQPGTGRARGQPQQPGAAQQPPQQPPGTPQTAAQPEPAQQPPPQPEQPPPAVTQQAPAGKGWHEDADSLLDELEQAAVGSGDPAVVKKYQQIRAVVQAAMKEREELLQRVAKTEQIPAQPPAAKAPPRPRAPRAAKPKPAPAAPPPPPDHGKALAAVKGKSPQEIAQAVTDVGKAHLRNKAGFAALAAQHGVQVKKSWTGKQIAQALAAALEAKPTAKGPEAARPAGEKPAAGGAAHDSWDQLFERVGRAGHAQKPGAETPKFDVMVDSVLGKLTPEQTVALANARARSPDGTSFLAKTKSPKTARARLIESLKTNYHVSARSGESAMRTAESDKPAQLSLTSPNPPVERATLSETARLYHRLSRGESMPDKEDDDLFSGLEEMDDDTDGDTDSPPDETPPAPVPGNDDEASTIAEAAADLQELGIEVPIAENALEFLKHLCTAVKTHKSTKSLENGEGDNQEGDIMPTAPAAPEPMPVAMSLQVQHLTKQLADERLEKVLKKVDHLVAEGQAKKTKADGWKKVLQARRLSLVSSGDDVQLAVVLGSIADAEETPKGTYWTPDRRAAQLSQVTQADAPEWVNGPDPEKAAQEQQEVINEMAAMVGAAVVQPRKRKAN